MKYSITLAATLAASAANAFKVCLYSDSNWAGENDGLVTVSLAHNQFSKVGVGVASSAIVQAEAGDKQSDSVGFWSDGSCSGNLVAEGDDGCIKTSSSFDNYMPFNVIRGDDPGKCSLLRDASPALVSASVEEVAEMVARTPADDIEYFYPMDPEWDESGVDSDKSIIYHSKEEPYPPFGMINGTKLPWACSLGSPLKNGTTRSDLEERSLEGIRDAFRNCAETVKTNAKGFTMNKVIPALVNAYVAADKGNTAVWNYIQKHPKAIKFVARIAGNPYVAGVGSIYLQSALSGSANSQVAKCSTQGTQAGTLVGILTHIVTVTSTVTSTEIILKAANWSQPPRRLPGHFRAVHDLLCRAMHGGDYQEEKPLLFDLSSLERHRGRVSSTSV